MVGGRTLSGNLDSSEQSPAGSKEGPAGLDSRQATYGQKKGESATGKGKQVISDAEQGNVTPSTSAVAGATPSICNLKLSTSVQVLMSFSSSHLTKHSLPILHARGLSALVTR